VPRGSLLTLSEIAVNATVRRNLATTSRKQQIQPENEDEWAMAVNGIAWILVATTFDVMHPRATDRRSASKCQGKWPDQTLEQAFG